MSIKILFLAFPEAPDDDDGIVDNFIRDTLNNDADWRDEADDRQEGGEKKFSFQNRKNQSLHNSINTTIMTGVEVITVLSKAWPIFVGFILLIVTLAQAHYRIKVLEEKVKVAFELINKLTDKFSK